MTQSVPRSRNAAARGDISTGTEPIVSVEMNRVNAKFGDVIQRMNSFGIGVTAGKVQTGT